MAYEDFKDLGRRTASNKALADRAFNTTKNHKYDGYQRGLASMVYNFFDKKSAVSGVNMHASKSAQTKKLVEELHKPIIRSFKKITVYYAFKDNIWDADLTDMQLIIIKGFIFLLCIIDIFSKHA